MTCACAPQMTPTCSTSRSAKTGVFKPCRSIRREQTFGQPKRTTWVADSEVESSDTIIQRSGSVRFGPLVGRVAGCQAGVGEEAKQGAGTVTVVALDEGPDCVITVEDDGVGVEPDTVRAALAGSSTSPSIGLGNVDERMRTTYGDDRGIVVETSPGLGTKVTLRVPKFAPE